MHRALGQVVKSSELKIEFLEIHKARPDVFLKTACKQLIKANSYLNEFIVHTRLCKINPKKLCHPVEKNLVPYLQPATLVPKPL